MKQFGDSAALRVEESQRVSLSLNNLTVNVKSEDPEAQATHILKNVSFDLPAHNIMAIMGGSGAGKTTLLNVLAQTINVHHSTLEFTGSIHYRNPLGQEPRISTAFMQQNDVFLPGLTLEETLDYQAQLRIPDLLAFERKELISSLLLLLELDSRAKEVVMSFTGDIRLSGGEQRRTSLAIQLLSKPQLLFLDEPTTGLDSTSALKLISILRKLASPEIGITIVLLIHQPRAEIVDMFDKLCVLARGGRTVYYGSLAESVTYFSELQSKAIVNDVESTMGAFAVINKIMKLLVKNYNSVQSELETTELVTALVSEWAIRHSYMDELSPEEQKLHFKTNLDIFQAKKPLLFHKELLVLTKRAFVISIRDITSLLTLVGGTLLLAVTIGWMFYKPNPNLAGIRSITSYLYVVLEVMGFCPIPMEINRLWTHEGIFFIREYKEKNVTAAGFILSRRLAKFFVEDLPILLIFSCISYFMGGLRLGQNYNDTGDASFFGIFFAVTLLVELVAMSSGMLCFFLGSSYAISSLYINVIYQIQNSGCGYFVNSKTMPVYVRWVKYLAYFWYGFGALNSNQYADWEGNCPYSSSDERCVQYSGNYQLETLGYPIHWVGAPIGYLVAWLVGFNLLIYIIVKLRRFDVGVAKKRKNTIKGDEDLSPEKILSALSNTSDEKGFSAEKLSISVKNVSLAVKVKDLLRFFIPRKSLRTLLHGIDAFFKENGVNVIMGPSGGGKTTFLNYLAHRLPKTSSYASTGQIFLNGLQDVTTSEISRISAYVTQHDNLLIPQLTVRETLYFQALLRLPINEHQHIASHVKTLLRKTGLVECADTPVGSASVKGISGGEKRRVSIAIQLLSRPKILFLDEPTSGLDLATSAAILTMLKALAEEGTTIITSIHQPSKEVFVNFDSMVLLARGGYVVYNGSATAVGEYLNRVGYACPDYVSIPDHVLDVVSPQVSQTKESSQARVDHLISSWAVTDWPKSQATAGRSIDLSKFNKHSVSLKNAFLVVCKRQFVISARASDVIVARCSQVLFLSAIYALFFAPLKNSQDGITNRLGLVQSVLNLYFCGLINNIALYPKERDVFHQEYKDGTYNSIVFSLAYYFVELPYEIIPSLIFSALVVFGIGLPRTAGMFFTMFYCSLVCINAGESAGMIFNSLITHVSAATNVLTSVFTIVIIMAGTMSLQMPSFFRAMNYLSPIKYVMQVLVNMSFKDQEFSCGSESTCTMDTGASVLEQYGLKARLGPAFGAITACFIIYRVVAVMFVYGRSRWFV